MILNSFFMGFWDYLGMAIVARYIFGKKKSHINDSETYARYYDAEMFRDRQQEAELDARVNNLSNRISALERNLDSMDSTSPGYETLRDDIETLRDDFDDLETDLE